MHFNYSKYNKAVKIIFSAILALGIASSVSFPVFITFAQEASPAETAPSEPTAPADSAAPADIPAPPAGDAPVAPESTVSQDGADLQDAATNTIETGNASSSADVTNIANSNSVDSETSVAAGSGSLGDSSLDLRSNFGSTTPSDNSSSTSSGISPLVDVSIENKNGATTTNDVSVTADTGNNTASSTATSTISTGDAYAAANVVNILNTNIVKSKFVLVVFNNLGDWSGDIVFPNGNFFADFLSNFGSGCLDFCGNTSISNDNTASVSNDLEISAESGNNAATGTPATVTAGKSDTVGNVLNEVNSNIIGGTRFVVLIQVLGNWTGTIFNLPAGLALDKSPLGLFVYNAEGGNPFKNLGEGETEIVNENNAVVENNINVSANTGENNAEGADSFIRTGNAYAAANLVNIVNTNVISANWAAALINILGDWGGNISFGQPDLWIGTVAEAPGSLNSGSVVKFTTTVKNKGDATASDIKVLAEPESISINGPTEWQIEPLKAGEFREFSYYGTLAGDFIGDSNVSNRMEVRAKETDANPKDNVDNMILSFFVSRGGGGGGGHGSGPSLIVNKTHSLKSSLIKDGEEMVPFGGTADYKIVVRNQGRAGYGGILYDELRDGEGKVLGKLSWELGEIKTGEEITVTYTAEFASSTSGVYTNKAWVEAYETPSFKQGDTRFVSNESEDKLIIAERPVLPITESFITAPEETRGEVLGVLTEGLTDEVFSAPNEMKFLEAADNVFTEEKTGTGEKINSFTIFQGIALGLSLILMMDRRDD